METQKIDVMVADASHEVYVDTILVFKVVPMMIDAIKAAKESK